MTDNKTYPEEIFEWRVNRYKEKKRTKLPHDEAAETSRRVNRLVYNDELNLKFPQDFLPPGEETSDGRLPINLFEVKFDYNSITNTTRITGSGGSVVLDNSVCMVDMARHFLEFVQSESCGECTFCRVGTKRLFEILSRICTGKGTIGDIDNLEVLAEKIHISSLCEIGKTAANPVLCTVRNYRKDYEDHIDNNKCRAGKCNLL
ncbi:NADH-ubiquinone oxidoreductase-F iron-sulfur binding region domain-containing protein [Spirochaetota bacterium]